MEEITYKQAQDIFVESNIPIKWNKYYLLNDRENRKAVIAIKNLPIDIKAFIDDNFNEDDVKNQIYYILNINASNTLDGLNNNKNICEIPIEYKDRSLYSYIELFSICILFLLLAIGIYVSLKYLNNYIIVLIILGIMSTIICIYVTIKIHIKNKE